MGHLAARAVVVIILLAPPMALASPPKLSGEVELDAIGYLHDGPEGTISGRRQLDGLLEARGEAAGFNYRASVDGRVDERDAERNRLRLKEAYVDRNLGPSFNVRLGKQIVQWGKADVFNPTNNVNSVDLSDPLDTDNERIPVVMALGNYYIRDGSIQALLVPSFEPGVLPSETSRWRPVLPETVAVNGVTAPAAFRTQLDPPPSGIGTAAIKLEQSKAGWDWSVSYLYGWAPLPAIRESLPTLDPQTGIANMTITGSYYRQSVIGGDFSTTAGAYGLRGEAALFIPESSARDAIGLSRNYVQFALGVDRTHSNVMGDNDLYWIVEVFGNTARLESTAVPGYFIVPYRYGFASKVEYRIGYEQTWGIEGLFDLKSGGYLVRPKFTYDISASLRAELLFDFLGGSQSSFGGAYSDNDRVQFRLRYKF